MIVKVTSAIAVRISAECAVDKSGKLDKYGGDCWIIARRRRRLAVAGPGSGAHGLYR